MVEEHAEKEDQRSALNLSNIPGSPVNIFAEDHERSVQASAWPAVSPPASMFLPAMPQPLGGAPLTPRLAEHWQWLHFQQYCQAHQAAIYAQNLSLCRQHAQQSKHDPQAGLKLGL